MTAHHSKHYVTERTAREQIAQVAREIYTRKLSGATDGNISVRIGNERIATTPSGVHKGRLTADQVMVVNLQGEVIGRPAKRADGTPLRPSSELALHLEAYRRRPDVGAVIHAHPPNAIAFTLAGGQLSQTLVSEVVFACGQIATAPYTTPTTNQVPEIIGEYMRCYDVVMMLRHGSVTLGGDLDSALAKLDALEHTAGIYCMVKLLGGATPIADPEVAKLFALAHSQTPLYRIAGEHCPAPEPPLALRDGKRAVGEVSGAVSGDGALIDAVMRQLGSKS